FFNDSTPARYAGGHVDAGCIDCHCGGKAYWRASSIGFSGGVSVMRLVTFSDAQGARVGIHDAGSGTIIDLSAGSRLPKDMAAFVALGRNGLQRARAAAKSGKGRIPVDAVK